MYPGNQMLCLILYVPQQGQVSGTELSNGAEIFFRNNEVVVPRLGESILEGNCEVVFLKYLFRILHGVHESITPVHTGRTPRTFSGVRWRGCVLFRHTSLICSLVPRAREGWVWARNLGPRLGFVSFPGRRAARLQFKVQKLEDAAAEEGTKKS